MIVNQIHDGVWVFYKGKAKNLKSQRLEETISEEEDSLFERKKSKIIEVKKIWTISDQGG